MNSKLKKIIKNKLNKDLSHVEIIFHVNNTIWFIDRENEYWYLSLEKSGKLWWRYEFFTKFFELFSMEEREYEPIISEWVEDILNRKVVSTISITQFNQMVVEEVLN
jgi:hypothetical protein